jgi:hypothetical protein
VSITVDNPYNAAALSSWEYGAGVTNDDAYLGLIGSAAVGWLVATQRLNLSPGEYFLNTLTARVAFTTANDNDAQLFIVYEKVGSTLVEVSRIDITSQKNSADATTNVTYQLGGFLLTIQAGKEYHFALAMRGPATRASGRPGLRFKASGWANDERATFQGPVGVATLATTITPTFLTDTGQVCMLLGFSTRNRILFSGSAASRMLPRRTDGVTSIKVGTFIGNATPTNINLVDTAGVRWATLIDHASNDLSFAGTTQPLTGQQGNTFDFLIQLNNLSGNLFYQNRTVGQGGQGAADITTISHRARNTGTRAGNYTSLFASWRFMSITGGGTVGLVEVGWEPIVIFGDSMSTFSGRLGQYLPPAFTFPRISWRASISGNALTQTSPGNHTAGHLRYQSTVPGTGDLVDLRDVLFCVAMFGLNDISRIGVNPALVPTVTDDYFARLEAVIDSLKTNGNRPFVIGLAPYHQIVNASVQEAQAIKSWIGQAADLAEEKRVSWITPWWDLVDQSTWENNIPLIKSEYTDDGGTHINIPASQLVSALAVIAFESGIVGGPWGSSYRRLRLPDAVTSSTITKNLPDVVRGDTLRSLTFNNIFKDLDDEAISPPGVVTAARLQFRRPDSHVPGSILVEQSLGNGITHTVVGDTWRFVTEPQIVSTSFVGVAEYDLEVTYTETGTGKTIVLTLFQGGTMRILKDVTR